ncbi:MAG: hypothetical protein P1U77_23295, partial [Rubripirellula sp.]|nr:hypothetical protein [Rubripirellula sp.]
PQTHGFLASCPPVELFAVFFGGGHYGGSFSPFWSSGSRPEGLICAMSLGVRCLWGGVSQPEPVMGPGSDGASLSRSDGARQ